MTHVAPKIVSTRVVKTRIGVAGVFEVEIDFGAFRAADPVALHGEHALRPAAFELRHVVEQLVGVIGDLEEPLLERALLDRRVFMPPAAAVHHLLVGQHGGALRTPVDQRLLAIGQAALEHLQEEPLVPAIVFGLAGGDFAIPVVGEREAAVRLLHGRDVCSVHSRGCRLLAMAAFSAGSPNASQPIGCSTLKPRIHL